MRRRAALLLGLSGFSALVYQTLWVKQLGLVVGVDVFAVTTGVAAFFAGLALGSYGFGRLADRSGRPVLVYAGLEAGTAVLGAAVTVALAGVPGAFVRLHASVGPLAWLLPIVLVGTPAFLMGGTLPVLLRALEPGEREIGRSSGTLYAANTAGAILGVIATPFLLIPSFGVRGAALSAAALNLVCAVLALAWRRTASRTAFRSTATAPLAREARLAVALYAAAGGTVAVLEQHSPTHTFRRLYIQGVSNSGDSMTSLRYMRLQALLPLLIHDGEPSSALVIGLGTGITAGALLSYPTLQHRVCAELHEMMLVGSMDPIVLDRERIARRFAIPGVGSALAEVGTGSPEALLATYVTGREGLERFVGDAPPVTDYRPRIEEAAWVRPNEISRVLPRVLDLARRPPLRGPAPGEQEAIDRERRILYTFYQAGLDAYAGDRPGWAESMKYVLREDPSNPYYRWFVASAPDEVAGSSGG